MPASKKTREELNAITGTVVDSAIKVHRRLGPGLLESAYQACLVYELGSRRLGVRAQVEVPIEYDGVLIEAGFPNGLAGRGRGRRGVENGRQVAARTRRTIDVLPAVE